MAVGIGPATEFLKESGFKLEKDGAVKVDKYLRVMGIDDVYATGTTLPFRTDIRRYCIVPICSTRR